MLKFQCYLVSFQRIFHAFSFFLVMFNNFLTIPVIEQKIKVKILLAIPTGAPTTLVNKMIDTPPLAALKTIKT